MGKTFGLSVPPQIGEMGPRPGPDTTDEQSAGHQMVLQLNLC